MQTTLKPANLVESTRVHRDVYVDPAIYALEMDRVFRRAWLYVGHESEIPKAGDYALTRLGPDEVILVRRDGGGLALLHNRCAHRGAAIVTEARGNVKLFRCPYHAWAYRLDGHLAAVPMREGYPPEFDLNDPANSLAPVPRVASYRGFIFASHAADGPDLPTFLSGLASALDNMVDRAPAGTITHVGGKLRMEYRGNWKLFMENATDLVHPGFVHASSVAAVRASPEAFKADTDTAQTAQMLLSNGLTTAEFDRLPLVAYGSGHHYMGGFYRDGVIALDRADPVFDRYRALLIAAHGETKTAEILAVDRFNNLIWPNISVNSRFAVLRHVQPIAVDRTIITSQC
ncbi:MAG: Rieske 2Fe-2S domain-containing protein, partial [Burkholderiales bacterium]